MNLNPKLRNDHHLNIKNRLTPTEKLPDYEKSLNPTKRPLKRSRYSKHDLIGLRNENFRRFSSLLLTHYIKSKELKPRQSH